MRRSKILMRKAWALSALVFFPSVLCADPETVTLSGWGFDSDGGFTLSEPAAGQVNLTAETPSSSSGASQIAFRAEFDPIGLTAGDSLTLTGKFSLSNSVEGADTYFGWSYAHIGVYNSNGNGGTLSDGVWSKAAEDDPDLGEGYTGYMMILTTGSSAGSGSSWGSGSLGTAGALVAGNTSSWYSQSGACGLGGSSQTPDEAGVGAGTYDFTLTITRQGPYLTEFAYHFQNEADGSDFLIEDTVYDTGVNDDGTTSAMIFDTVGFSSASSRFTDWNFSDLQVSVVRGSPNDPNTLYDFEDNADGWAPYQVNGEDQATVSRVTLDAGTTNDEGALAVTMPNGDPNWATELSLDTSTGVGKKIVDAYNNSVDLTQYALAFDVTFLTANSNGYTGDVDIYAALQSGMYTKSWGTGKNEVPPLSVTWDANKIGTVTLPLSEAVIDSKASTLNFFIGMASDATESYTVLVDNVRLVSLDPTPELRKEVAAKFFNMEVDDDGYTCPAMGWVYAGEYPYLYSYDLDTWRGVTSDYTFGWLWCWGDFDDGAWFWDYFTEKWFYSDSECWPWAYFYDYGWVDLEEGHDAILDRYAMLPDPLVFNDGTTTVEDRYDWITRRGEIKELLQHYVYGHKPTAPDSIEITDISDWSENTWVGAYIQTLTVKMTVGENSVTTTIEVDIPTDATADVPRPIIMTEGAGGWGWYYRMTYLQKGWCGVGVNFTEFAPDDNVTVRTGKLYQLFGTDIDTGALMAWAWAYSRAIDVLQIMQYPEVDMNKIAVTGHSRYGKCALVTGAFDERIALTAPSHSGTGGAAPFKVPFPGGEAMSVVTGSAEGYWLSSVLKDYVDDPDALPVDQHMALSLIAPRGLIQIEGTLDPGTNPKGTQLSYQAARRVYEAIGMGDKIGIRFRPVAHVANDDDVISFANHLWDGDDLPEGFDLMPYAIAPAEYELPETEEGADE